MNSILVVIPFCAGDAARTEQLLEWIFELAERHQRGHCLLIAAPNVHPEMREKVKIAGEVAFKTCDLESPLIPENATKPSQITQMVSEAAKLVRDRYRMPWLLMEPDCVPVSPGWIASLSEAYAAQPKRLMGVKLQKVEPPGKTLFQMARIGVYSSDYSPTEMGVINKMSTTRLIQLMTFSHGMTLDKIKPEAVLIHSDKEGNVIRLMREKKEVVGMSACAHKVLELDSPNQNGHVTLTHEYLNGLSKGLDDAVLKRGGTITTTMAKGGSMTTFDVPIDPPKKRRGRPLKVKA